MSPLSGDYVSAVVPEISSDQQEAIVDFLRSHWRVSRVELHAAEHPGFQFAHSVSCAETGRLFSRLVNSLSWQDEKRLSVVSFRPEGVLTENEQTVLLRRGIANLKKKLPKVDIVGLVIDPLNHVTILDESVPC